MKPNDRSWIDLNCDMGEVAEAITDRTQSELMQSVSSVNVACGGHAGDPHMMKVTLEQALRAGVSIGAHPGYPDRENFGRLPLQMAPGEVAKFVFEQIQALAKVAEESGARIVHVKPHGALYNQAVGDRVLAGAIAQGVKRWRADLVLVGLAGSSMLEVFREAGFAVAAEAFADRRYERDGTLRSRRFDDALLSEPEQAARQALSIVERAVVLARDGSQVPVQAETICIHGDTPGAARIAAAVVTRLQEAGVRVGALGSAGKKQRREGDWGVRAG